MKIIPLDAALPRRVAPPTSRRAVRARRLHMALAELSVLLREWRRRTRSRADLARLDHRMLRDIGITRAEALHEIDKPFWRK